MSDTECQVQALESADIDQVIALDTNLGGEARPEFFQKKWQAMSRSPDWHIGFVAKAGNDVRGYLFANILKGEFGHQQPVAVLDAIGVQPGEQCSGMGMKLMQALKAEAKKRGCGDLHTQANWAQQDLLSYFANSGFELAPRHVLKRDTSALHIDDDEDIGLRPVRSLTAEDLNSIIRIDRHITGEERGDYLQQMVDEVMSNSGIRVSMVAEQDGMVAGFIMAKVDYGSFGRAESTAVVDTIGVGPEYKGHGIGSALVGQLLDNLASLQVEHLRTEVEWDNFELNRFLGECDFKPAQQIALSCAL